MSNPADRGPRRLFTPIDVGPLTLCNRIVFSAHLTNAALDGLPTAQHAAYYAARAAGGAGLVITEEHSVHPADRPYEKLIRGHDPAVLPGYRRLTDAVHAHGVPVLAQLNHNGGQSCGMYSRTAVWAPSAVPDPMFREVPKAVTVAEIREIVDGYAMVAGNCAEGGFDGVELQCSHASLLRQFLSPLTNHRTDGYGGPLQNRVRIVREVVAAVRAAIGPGMVLGVRLCGDEGIAGGTSLDEAVETARMLEQDIDYVNTSIGVATATLHLIEAPMPVRPGYALFIPSAIRAAVALPVIGVGRFTTHKQAEQAIAEGNCDLVGVVRGQIADPSFGASPTRACVACNQECVGRVGRNQRLGCVVNPRVGREGMSVPGRATAGSGTGAAGGATAEPMAGPTARAVAGSGHGPTARPSAGAVAGPTTGPTAGEAGGPITGPMAGPTARAVAGSGHGPTAGPTAGAVAGPTTGPTAGEAGGPITGPTAGVVAGATPEPAGPLNPGRTPTVDRRAAPGPTLLPGLRRTRVLVVGGGPAGLAAAAAAAECGHRVVLCERALGTGGQITVAASAPGRAELANLTRDLLARCRRAGVEIRTGLSVQPYTVAAERPDAVVLATGARPQLPTWAGAVGRFDRPTSLARSPSLRAPGVPSRGPGPGAARTDARRANGDSAREPNGDGAPGDGASRASGGRVVDVRDVLTGRARPSGDVLVYDELGFHEATSVAELLAGRGCRVEITTPGLVVGQDLGLTLDMELFHRRAHAAGIALTTDRVVLVARDAGRVAVTMLHHLVGVQSVTAYDWVVCAVPPTPEDDLWHALRGREMTVHRIGDCLAPRRAHAAIAEGERVGESL